MMNFLLEKSLYFVFCVVVVGDDDDDDGKHNVD